jgi:hypothetical protein
MMTERELRDRAIGSAAYWLDCSEHEQTPEDAKILARYARLAINRIVELETALKPFAENHGWVVRNRSPEYMPHQDSHELARWSDLCRAAEVLKGPSKVWVSDGGGDYDAERGAPQGDEAEPCTCDTQTEDSPLCPTHAYLEKLSAKTLAYMLVDMEREAK